MRQLALHRVVLLFALLVWSSLATSAWAGSVELAAKTRKLEVEQTIWLTLEIVDENPTAVPQIVGPDNVDIQYSHRSSGTFQRNFRVTRTTEFLYKLRASEPGVYTVGPVSVPLAKGTVETGTLKFEITPRSEDEREAVEAFGGFGTSVAWEGQVLVYHYGIRSRLKVYRQGWTKPPLDGFVAPRDGRVETREYSIGDPEGDLYVQETFQPLVVTGVGEREVRAAVVRLDVQAGSRGGIRRLVAKTEDNPVTVKRLPPAPAGFSGLVGEFQFQGKLDRTTAEVGESLQWNIGVRGNGSLEGFAFEKAGDVEGARIYDGTPRVGAEVGDDGYSAGGLYERVVVPTKTGTLQIPPVEVVTFSPAAGRYVTHKVEIPPIEVGGEEGEGGFTSFGETPEGVVVEERGIRDIWRSGAAESRWLAPYLPWMLAITGGPGLLLGIGQLGVLGARRVRQRFGPADREPTPLERLRGIPSSGPERVAALEALTREAVSRASGLPIAAPRREVLAAIPEDAREEVGELLKRFDRIRFAGTEAAPADLAERVERVLRALAKGAS